MSEQQPDSEDAGKPETAVSPVEILIAVVVAIPLTYFLLVVAMLGDWLLSTGSFAHARLETPAFHYVVKNDLNAVFALKGFVDVDDADENCLAGLLVPDVGAVMRFSSRGGLPRLSVEGGARLAHPAKNGAVDRPAQAEPRRAGRLREAGKADRDFDEITVRWHETCAAGRASLTTLIFGPGAFGSGLQTLQGYASIGTATGIVHVYGRSVPVPGLAIERELFAVFEGGFELPPGAVLSAEPIGPRGIVSLGSEHEPKPHWRGFAEFDFARSSYAVTIETSAKTIHIRHIIGDLPSEADKISITAISRILRDPTLQLLFSLGSAILAPVIFCIIRLRRIAPSIRQVRARISKTGGRICVREAHDDAEDGQMTLDLERSPVTPS